VLFIGGFSGQDEVLTVAQLEELVSSGELRFVLTQGNRMGPGGIGGSSNSAIYTWVTQHCTQVSGFQVSGLYDCAAVGS
jgi:hypothetical protein